MSPPGIMQWDWHPAALAARAGARHAWAMAAAELISSQEVHWNLDVYLSNPPTQRGGPRLAVGAAGKFWRPATPTIVNMTPVNCLSSPDIFDCCPTISADFQTPRQPATGCRELLPYINDGELKYEYVYSELIRHTIQRPFQPKPDKLTNGLEFRRTGKNAGDATLKVGGKTVGAVDIPRSWQTHVTAGGGEDQSLPISEAQIRPFHHMASRVVIELEGLVGDKPGAAYQAVLRE